MKDRGRRFHIVDALLIALTILPPVIGIVLQLLTSPVPEDIAIEGAHIFFTLKMPLQNLPITESQVNAWLVMLSILGLSLYLTHGITQRGGTRRQIVAEWIVEKTEALVSGNMDSHFSGFTPFIGAILALSALSSLISLIGLYPPTSDLNVIAGWSILVISLITYYKMKAGVGHYLKSFGDPYPALAPLNIISEIATPVSMTFRHYGNILSGTVISALLAGGLQGASAALLGWLPGVLGRIPFLQIGLPAVLSIYFDVFSGCMQAFIFAMLTMLYISDSSGDAVS